MDMNTEDYEKELNDLFTKLFDETNEDVSIADLYLLSDMPSTSLATFGERWATLSDDRRRTISRHLADISEENFQVDFSPVSLLLFKDPLTEVRTAALDTLWDTTNINLIEPIIKLMQEDEASAVRASAAATLGHFILMAHWDELPRHIEQPIVEALVPNLHNDTLDPAIRRATIESLAGSSYPEIERHIELAYEDGDPQMQRSAVFAMGRTANKRWLPIVLNELEHYDSEMRAEAAQAAGVIGSAEASPALVELAYYDEDLEVRLTAVIALGAIGGDVASRALSQLAEDPEAADLHETIDDALEEMMWMGGEFDLSLLDIDDEDWDD